MPELINFRLYRVVIRVHFTKQCLLYFDFLPLLFATAACRSDSNLWLHKASNFRYRYGLVQKYLNEEFANFNIIKRSSKKRNKKIIVNSEDAVSSVFDKFFLVITCQLASTEIEWVSLQFLQEFKDRYPFFDFGTRYSFIFRVK